MSKSFKNILKKEPSIIPDSKKDILDLFQEERENLQPKVIEVTPVLPVQELKEKEQFQIEEIDKVIELRQTFIIGSEYLENLKDYVHTKRVTGDYQYTQKHALHDALDLLFKGIELIKRPDEIRLQAEKRSVKIKKGIQSR